MKKKIKLLKLFIYSIGIQILSFLIRRDERYLAFGSWCGELYIDNSKYLFEYALNNLEDCKFVWIGDKELRKDMPYDSRIILVKKDSFLSIIALLKCKYMFCTQMHRADLSSYNVYRGAVIYSLDHGVPVKKWAQDAVGYKGEYDNINILRKIYQVVIGENRKYNYFITASPLHDMVNLSALAYRGATVDKNFPSGTPRNDILINYDDNFAIKCKKKYADLIGFDM